MSFENLIIENTIKADFQLSKASECSQSFPQMMTEQGPLVGGPKNQGLESHLEVMLVDVPL